MTYVTDHMVGRVGQLWRYPVKSLLGQELTEVSVGSLGLTGDRRVALLDLEADPDGGRVASAKSPRRWRDLLQLTAVQVSAAGGDGAAEVRITGPKLPSAGLRLSLRAGAGTGIDGAAAGTGGVGVGEVPEAGAAGAGAAEAEAAEWLEASRLLSELLGRQVLLTRTPPKGGGTLERSRPDEVLAAGPEAAVGFEVGRLGGAAPAGAFFDFAPVHLLASSTLDLVAREHPDGRADAERYRPNLVIRTLPGAGDAFVENDWVGQLLCLGEELTLRVFAATPRCAVPTLAHGALARDPDALRIPARRNRIHPVPGADYGPEPCLGVYAQVVTPGRVRVGDAVRLTRPSS